MTDRYAMINHCCCSNPRLQLIHEPSLGYQPFVCCLTCNYQTHFDQEEEE